MPDNRMKIVEHPSSAVTRFDLRLTDDQGHDWTKDVAQADLPVRMILVVDAEFPERKGMDSRLRFDLPPNARFLDDEGDFVRFRVPMSGKLTIYRPVEFFARGRHPTVSVTEAHD